MVAEHYKQCNDKSYFQDTNNRFEFPILMESVISYQNSFFGYLMPKFRSESDLVRENNSLHISFLKKAFNTARFLKLTYLFIEYIERNLKIKLVLIRHYYLLIFI